MKPALILMSVALVLSGCKGDSSSTPPATVNAPSPAERVKESAVAQCVINDPRRLVVSSTPDAPGPLEVTVDTPLQPASECADNQRFQVGTGIYDITATIADTASLAWVNPQQVFSALHTRVYSRAFVIASPCNGKRILFVSLDTGLMSATLRDAILAEIAADPELSPHYNGNNVMLSVTHTHSDPGIGLNEQGNGLQVIAGGTYQAIRNAHLNLEANPEPASIRLSAGELLNTNINRSKPAYALNPADERALFTNTAGNETQVNKRMVQLELSRGGQPVGLINWFGVHPTVIGPAEKYVSGDVKGYASLGFEELMGTDYRADPSTGTYVAAFAQADEGDASPNIAIEDFPYPSKQRGGGENDLDANAISGVKQLAKALELFGTGSAITGPVDFRFATVPITDITVTDQTVLKSLNHSDDEEIRTCDGILGVSFGAGAEDGPGPTKEGYTCSDDPDVLNAALADIQTLEGQPLEGFPGGWPKETIPGQVLSAAVMCNAHNIPGHNFSCQAEKPVLLPRGDKDLPFQLFRVGNFALLGLPWEVTTMAARRIRSLLLEELAAEGIDNLVIAGLVNNYVHYLTTREEYASQQYEGASTLYGPWTQAAVAQESLRLARAMVNGDAQPDAPATGERADLTLVAGPTESPHHEGDPGKVTLQPPSIVSAGDILQTRFVVGHPGNDLRIQQSYVTVERMQADGSWQTVVEDRSPELIYEWEALVQPPLALERPLTSSGGTALVIWNIPRNAAAGTYRIRVEGASRVLSAEASSYEAITETFVISGPVAECP
ncbi:neutral ceramidase [Litorivivens lipolytica]|uniref:Neutral ceramidase n=1 Tax=Litorivivens lipolytica TaxID=1524264 RepID=A0A7W4Z4Z9_9GAMM|nr:neutral/alkaline non-lysosomal ceramidase N-terminal domain-containing protein [Litorivivens lipolytica]MBB3046999.1 neutral ceramidase [Litorivivens lipolytica]